MKRFIIISLLSALTLPMLACAWVDTHNSYLFRMYDNNEFKSRVEKVCNDNWQAYLGTHENYYWFDAEKVIEAARQKGDLLMVSYVQNLQKYLQCVAVEQQKQYEWNYPTKEQLAACTRNLQAIRSYALGKTKTRLRSQHALLYMRCNMMLGRHQENIAYWEQTASQLIETVYKDMMKNIYAGALYKSGQADKAGEMFAEMGDYESLMTQYYKKRSFQAIQQEYKKNPNALVLPFLLQDFVNNTQEAIDAVNDEYSYGGKLFIRDISRQEAMQMQQFCGQVVSEGKTSVPILWQSAKAWIEFLWGDRREAARDIVAAVSLDGTGRMKDCARELMLYITAAQAKPGPVFDDYLADELQWLYSRGDETGYVVDRLCHQVLFKHYAEDSVRVAALMNMQSSNYGYLDTAPVGVVEKYMDYVDSPAANPLDRFLKSRTQENSRQQLEELVGTKYMRLCQWDKAVRWLQNIPASFYAEKGYAVYIANRRYTVEPWITRQWLSDDVTYSDAKWQITANPKLTYAKEMMQMEASLPLLKGKALEQACYDLAVRYAQANFRGDCWWLMRDGKSVCDTLRENETDLGAKAVAMLRRVTGSADKPLRTKALFALCYRELYADGGYWQGEEWNGQEYVQQYYRQSPQYHAFQHLCSTLDAQGGEPAYVSRCDEYQQFRKVYK